MRKIEKGIVFSDDIKLILRGSNALDFDYYSQGMKVPSDEFIEYLRKNFFETVNTIFNGEVTIISEDDMLDSIWKVTSDVYKKFPIISLDKIYLPIDNKNIIFLDCTRMSGEQALTSRGEPNNSNKVNEQIELISRYLRKLQQTKIILADDVVFSGSVMRLIIEKFASFGIEVIGIRSCIATSLAYSYFNDNLLLGLKCEYLLGKEVIDQICERDFYFGIVQSGISVRDGLEVFKAPYFYPYGDPVERASIPYNDALFFSKSCIDRSLFLWEEIERLSNRSYLIDDLPERIKNTNATDGLIRTLKKGIN